MNKITRQKLDDVLRVLYGMPYFRGTIFSFTHYTSSKDVSLNEIYELLDKLVEEKFKKE